MEEVKYPNVRGCRYKTIADFYGNPCLVAVKPSGREVIISIMNKDEHGYEHAEALCDAFNERAAQAERMGAQA